MEKTVQSSLTHRSLSKRLLMLSLLALSPAFASERPLQLEDKGLDGAQRIYSVRCPDDHRISLRHQFKQNRICYVAKGHSEICLPARDLDAVADMACRQSMRGKR